MNIELKNGDCIEKMKEIEENSVDLILTDPPYHLTSIVKRFGKEGSKEATTKNNDGSFNRLSKGFMGKSWDGLDENGVGIAFNPEIWKEVLRVLKPGGYLMSFGGTRTYHRMAVAIEDAGFEVKDMIEWVYGSGFPKALDISKALDKKLGENNIAKQYEGYKTALKPAHEPIVLAMKPIEGSFADNVMKWGTGGLNIDGTRVGNEKVITKGGDENTHKFFNGGFKKVNIEHEGRYPANFIISEDIAPILDEQSGYSKSSNTIRRNNQSKHTGSENGAYCYGKFNDCDTRGYADEGGASRFFYNAKIENEDYTPFFYTAKTSKKERNSDINGQAITGDTKKGGLYSYDKIGSGNNREVLNVNNHPTVKPKSILKYLLNLGLPPQNSTILDPFAGSGSIALALKEINEETNRNHKLILIEKEKEHCEIIKKRCNIK